MIPSWRERKKRERAKPLELDETYSEQSLLRMESATLYGKLQIAETALHRIASPECETFHGSRDRVASDALYKLREFDR